LPSPRSLRYDWSKKSLGKLEGRVVAMLLENPSTGLAPLVVEEIRRIIADHAYILQSGRIELSGPADEIARNEKVVAAYLGG
jgi:branched-chain amino acid transport system ATP-binding protein